MKSLDRAQALQRIERNIRQSGFHLYIITAGSSPRYAYTIGLSQSLGAELILAGAVGYLLDDVKRIIDEVRRRQAHAPSLASVMTLDALGSFTLRAVHDSWARSLMLGAFDYYKGASIVAWQIVPDDGHRTIDVPDLAREQSADAEPAWRWLAEPWPYAVPEASNAMVDPAALRGARITEATRWEEDYWELFAVPGPDVERDDARLVPLGTLLATDPSLSPILDLEIGGALWRDDEDGDWNVWASSSAPEE
jgi:hypothetical protein